VRPAAAVTERNNGNPDSGRLAGGPAETGPLRAWLGATFHGITWKRLGIFCLMVLVLAASKPFAYLPLVSGEGFEAFAAGYAKSTVFILMRYAPLVLFMVAAVNRGSRDHRRQVVSLIGGALVGEALGVTLVAAALPILAPDNYIVRLIDEGGSTLGRAVRWTGWAVVNDLHVGVLAAALWLYLRREVDAATDVEQELQFRDEVERENAEARLSALQAQIEPHFLFNALANIRRLYETDAASGRTMLRHLSHYLTASLPVLRETASTLGRELALVLAYLNVQRIRMGPRLSVDVDVPQPLHAIHVPPMMLATLVENSIIHGLGPLQEGGRICINARVDEGKLTIEVVDDGRGLQDAWGVGVGLANIQARLRHQFGASAELQLVDAPNRGVVARIDLPAEFVTNAGAA